ncbi:MAG: class I SAM-dependent methyltransferase [Eubacteriaceae bacterium]|nr:class I SAM-dependent methyltransferase [Eubacteriaceae bacterium]
MPGQDRQRRDRFDEIAANYDRVRPQYPAELFSDIFEYSKMSPGKKALEIGSGTGKATQPFLDAGYTVDAVEIGANMAAFIQEKYKGYSNFNVINADFEDAALEENSYSIVYAATAFHWINAEIGCPKMISLLQSGGVAALFRVNAIAACGEDYYEDIQAVYEEHYYSFFQAGARPAAKTKDDFKKLSEILLAFGFESLEQYGFGGLSMKVYDATRIFSSDEYIAWLDSMSDHRSLPEANRAALYSGIKESILRHGGRHKVDFIYQLYMGTKP